MDNRTNLMYKAFHKSRDTWFKKMGELGIQMYVLLGNHDICYRHTLEINSPELLLGEYDHITVIKEPTQIDVNGTKIDIIPWICDENEEEIKQFVSRKDHGLIACGHLELSGFPMHKGGESHNTGMSADLFDRYSIVYTGHYHTRSEKGNIIYTGVPYEITWSDYADPKGFYVYDTEKNTYEFIRNPITMFEKVTYQNGSKVNISSLAGKIVKVIVQEKKDPILYERWLDSIRLVSPYELSIIENATVVLDGDLDDTIEIGDTPSLIKNYIDQIDTSV
jgi:DNA repair exonuclease SbcCD nuclease subunit